LLEQSEWCGCFYCLGFFRPPSIKEWVDDGQTAKCPGCGIDAVLPDKSLVLIDSMDSSMTWSLFFLQKMHERWFSPSGKNAKRPTRS
jgi:hypothetical protein